MELQTWSHAATCVGTMLGIGTHPARTIIIFEMVELSGMCAEIVVHMYLAPIGRPDFSWRVEAPVRAVTKWNRACDKTMGDTRKLSQIHYGLSTIMRGCEHKTLIFAGYLTVDIWWYAVCIWRSPICIFVSWACKKHTALSHRTEAQAISSDIGLRMDGVIAVNVVGHCDWRLGPLPVEQGVTFRRQLKPKTFKTMQESTDYVPPIAIESSNRPHLCLCEDNEAVIKTAMIVSKNAPHQLWLAFWENHYEFEHLRDICSHQSTDRRFFFVMRRFFHTRQEEQNWCFCWALSVSHFPPLPHWFRLLRIVANVSKFEGSQSKSIPDGKKELSHKPQWDIRRAHLSISAQAETQSDVPRPGESRHRVTESISHFPPGIYKSRIQKRRIWKVSIGCPKRANCFVGHLDATRVAKPNAQVSGDRVQSKKSWWHGQICCLQESSLFRIWPFG